MASRHRIVVALVGEAPLRTEGSTSMRLFFLIESQSRRLSGKTASGLSPLYSFMLYSAQRTQMTPCTVGLLEQCSAHIFVPLYTNQNTWQLLVRGRIRCCPTGDPSDSEGWSE
jgi:hypothetical protein